jgi:hypothetical protein
MNAPTTTELYIVINILVVLALVYSLVKFAWNHPLRHGPGYFLNVEVPAGFYEGPGKSWLGGYRAILVAVYAALAVALGACFALGRLDATPLWLGGWALLYVPALVVFQAWTRYKLGANPPVRPVALALESRRLGDYISWPLEALLATAIASSWWMLLGPGGTQSDWLNAVQLTWFALGLLPARIAAVRSTNPLPVERTEEHYRYQDATRRIAVSVLSALAWYLVAILFGMGLRHAWSPARTVTILQWFIRGGALAFGGYCIVLMFHGQRRLASMGRDLRPAGSWSTPFRRAPWIGISRPYLIWFAIWFGILLVLIVYSLFR